MRPPLAAVLCLVLLSGCATMVRSRSQDVRFATVPPGASLTLEGRRTGSGTTSPIYYATCVTPCTLALGRSNTPVTYRLQADGHHWYDGTLLPVDNISPAQVLPLVFDVMLVFPYIVDLSSGTLTRWPAQVTITMSPVGSTAPPNVSLTY